MNCHRPKKFITVWKTHFREGLHAILALSVAGLTVQAMLFGLSQLLALIPMGDGGSTSSGARAAIVVVFAILVGLPLFGFLFVRAYSLTEPRSESDPVSPSER